MVCTVDRIDSVENSAFSVRVQHTTHTTHTHMHTHTQHAHTRHTTHAQRYRDSTQRARDRKTEKGTQIEIERDLAP